MKRVFAVFGSLLVLASIKSKAQSPQQPVKKETVKPTNGTAPKADAVEIFLKLDGIKGEANSASPTVAKGANPAFLKGASPTVAKGANPTLKGAQSATNQQVAPRHAPPPANNQVAPRRARPKG